MKLYFMRHGHAVPGGNMPDPERTLTPEGVLRVKNAAQVLARLKIEPAHIFCSPRVRAVQTGELVAEALDMSIEITEAVNFGFNKASVESFIVDYGDVDLMFVGHEPTMSTVISNITGGMVNMKPGSFARVDVMSTLMLRGDLVWLIAPKVFDALSD